MVVVREPAVKRGGALGGAAVDGAVGPTGDQRSDEPLGLAVGLGPVGTGAEVTDPERAAGDRVDRSALGGAVVGQHALDRESVPGEELDCPPQEGDDRGRLVIAENFGVGQARVVVDRDVHALPACDLARDPRRVCSLGATAPIGHTDDPGTGAVLDPPELLDVDVDQLARARAFVPLSGLESDPSELAQPDPGQIPDTVDGAIPSTSAIFGPVNRSRRSAAIAWIRRSLVRCGIDRRC
jgi:hypothetical protein